MSMVVNMSRRTPHMMSKKADQAVREQEADGVNLLDSEEDFAGSPGGFSPNGNGDGKRRRESVYGSSRRSKKKKPMKFDGILKGLSDALEQAQKKWSELDQWYKDWSLQKLMEEEGGACFGKTVGDGAPMLSPREARHRVAFFDDSQVPNERNPDDSGDLFRMDAAPLAHDADAHPPMPMSAQLTGGDCASGHQSASVAPSAYFFSEAAAIANSAELQNAFIAATATLTQPTVSQGAAGFRMNAPAHLNAVGTRIPSTGAEPVPEAPWTPPGLTRLSVASSTMIPGLPPDRDLTPVNGNAGAGASLTRGGSQVSSFKGGDAATERRSLSRGDSTGPSGSDQLASSVDVPKRSTNSMYVVADARGAGLISREPSYDSAETGDSDPGFGALRVQWAEVPVEAIVKYEKELEAKESRMKRTSSKMSPTVSELPKKRFFPWLSRSNASQHVSKSDEPLTAIAPSPESSQKGNRDVPSAISAATLGSEVSTFAGLHRSPSFQKVRRKLYFNLVCHPQGMQRLIWDIVSIVLISYDMITLPMYAFSFTETPRLQLMEWVCTIFWTVDIVMSFRTGYYQGPKLIMDLHMIAKHYTRSWFAVDMIIVIPEWVARAMDWVVEGLNAARIGRVTRFVRFIRLIRIIKMGHFSEKIEEVLGNNFMLLGFSLTKLSMILAVSVHFLTCLWYSIGASDQGSWVELEGLENESLLLKYVAAARWTLAQINGRTDQADNRTMAEKAYTVACAFFTVLFMSIFVSTLTTRMMELQKLMDEETRYTKMLMNYLEHKKVSYHVSYLAKHYVKNQNKVQSEQDTETKLMKILPNSLKADLLYEVRSPLLAYHPFFADIKADFYKVIHLLCSQSLRVEQATTAHKVFTKDEELEVMFVMERGDLRYAEDEALTPHVAKNAERRRTRRSVLMGVDKAKSAVIDSIVRTVPFSIASVYVKEDDLAAKIPGLAVQTEGTLISEGALWTKWRSRGELIAVSTSVLLKIDVTTFSNIISRWKDLECRAARYARLFQWRISQMDDHEVSDLTTLDTHHLPPHAERRAIYTTGYR